MTLTNKAYDIVKWFAQYFIPAFGTLYFALAAIWGLPYGEQILGTLTAIDLFLAAILGMSAHQYAKTVPTGTLMVDDSEGMPTPYLVIDPETLSALKNKSSITLSVGKSKK